MFAQRFPGEKTLASTTFGKQLNDSFSREPNAGELGQLIVSARAPSIKRWDEGEDVSDTYGYYHENATPISQLCEAYHSVR